jgi:DNA-directed RNA polymerase specialized sigma24 family protein
MAFDAPGEESLSRAVAKADLLADGDVVGLHLDADGTTTTPSRRRPAATEQLPEALTVRTDCRRSGRHSLRAVRGLPRRQREVVTLHYLVDLTRADVATVLGISESSVKT